MKISLQAKIQTLKVKNANNEKFQIYPRTLIQCVTNENGDKLENILGKTTQKLQVTIMVHREQDRAAQQESGEY